MNKKTFQDLLSIISYTVAGKLYLKVSFFGTVSTKTPVLPQNGNIARVASETSDKMCSASSERPKRTF